MSAPMQNADIRIREARLTEGDYIFVPGMDFNYVNSIPFKAERE